MLTNGDNLVALDFEFDALAVLPDHFAIFRQISRRFRTGLPRDRDDFYVGNTVDGFLAAAQSDAAIGRTINLGSGREISVGDLAALIGRLLGRELRIEQDSKRVRPEKSEVERLLADNTLAHRLLDWQPQVTLEDGLKTTIEWLRGNLDRYRPNDYVV